MEPKDKDIGWKYGKLGSKGPYATILEHACNLEDQFIGITCRNILRCPACPLQSRLIEKKIKKKLQNKEEKSSECKR